jgi:hypothetical protein
MSVTFTVDFSRVLHEIGRLADGPGHDGTTFRLEGIMLQNFGEVEEAVHVITGRLKAGGHPESSFDGDRWTGTIAFPRHPGIFELARGDTPTQNHPEGLHNFLRSSYTETPERYKAAILGFLRGENSF